MKFNGECNLIGHHLKQSRLLHGKIYLNIEKLNSHDRATEILKVSIVGNFEWRLILSHQNHYSQAIQPDYAKIVSMKLNIGEFCVHLN